MLVGCGFNVVGCWLDVPDWMQTGVLVSMRVLGFRVTPSLIGMMRGVEMAPAAMATAGR